MKRLPQRTCVACREVKAKRELVRIVRTAGGSIEVDTTGKKAGRGAYLCKSKTCWETGIKKNRLEHTLKTSITSEDKVRLLTYAETLPGGVNSKGV
ncbi:MAG: YlxR family protein [Chloroflexi bacterium]|nr:YlxR family protein [Chloroflexota bacterium]